MGNMSHFVSDRPDLKGAVWGSGLSDLGRLPLEKGAGVRALISQPCPGTLGGPPHLGSA